MNFKSENLGGIAGSEAEIDGSAEILISVFGAKTFLKTGNPPN